MATRPSNSVLLHRDDPEKAPLSGNIKVTREDWINASLAILVEEGAERVKIAPIAARLDVSRSSFYWYFKSRKDLMDALLDYWRAFNTAALVTQAGLPAERITGAVCNVFKCVINPALFDNRLDFAIRDWARKDRHVRTALDASDALRLRALSDMFERYDYPPFEAKTRARILYYMQVGYTDAELQEPMSERLAMVPMYLLGFTGQLPTDAEFEDVKAYTAPFL